MNKKLKFILLILSCVIFIALVIFISKKQYDSSIAKEKAEQEKLEESVSNLTKINVDKFIELLSSNDTKIILVASLECPHCTAIKPKINELAKDLNVEISYLELTTMTEDDQKKFYSSNEFLSEGTSIPLVVAVRNNEVVDNFVGNIEKNEIETFIKSNLNLE